jgi:two-component sensor histidine kinase
MPRTDVEVLKLKTTGHNYLREVVSKNMQIGSVDILDGSEIDRLDALRFRKTAVNNLKRLTPRQNETLDLLLDGYANKNIAHELKISQRTVENHRAAIGKRLGAHSLAELVHISVCGKCPIEVREAKLAEGKRTAGGLRGEEIVRMDMREVGHRLKNFSAVLLSLCNQTAINTKSPAEFASIFAARLSAYCRSLDAFVAGDWSDIDIDELAALQLTPFGLLDGDRFSLSGPGVNVTPVAAHALGMALHELATNAVKYGALSAPAGHIDVKWESEGAELVVTWRETNGPVVTKPGRAGFGLQLIQKLTASALDGSATLDFPPDGVKWELRVPRKHWHKTECASPCRAVQAGVMCRT